MGIRVINVFDWLKFKRVELDFFFFLLLLFLPLAFHRVGSWIVTINNKTSNFLFPFTQLSRKPNKSEKNRRKTEDLI